MAEVEWGSTDPRFERGVYHGVLYPYEDIGVVWNGLVSISETTAEAEISTHHFDGIKYYDFKTNGVYQASLKAFSYPYEFEPSIGIYSAQPGFLLANQPRRPFGLAYRTLVGSSEYKLHLLYNVTATSKQITYKTVGERIQPTMFEWTLDAVPPESSTFKPTAHLVIESDRTETSVLTQIESIVYGDSESEPRLPSQSEVVDIFTS